ncbi:MAG: UDP-N-acetylmuramate--L-alanine ligase [Kiritimatiellia bacterium]|nr:UDP-N-acetylmuramate--L-alanine ligase [Kiritimatiellia bacterium]
MSDNNDITGEIADIRKFLLRKNSRVHLLGICGVGMAGLAFILKRRGFKVSGCDQSPNHLAGWLKKRGIAVFSGHDPSHVISASWIIRSSAVAENHPELQAARKAGKKVFRRGLVLAAISSGADSICIGGTHGKTTTTAMVIQLMNKAGLKPSFCIGGEAPLLGGVAGRGTGKNIVLEADESDGTLAYYKPFIAVITNIEFDHAEHFKNLTGLKKCFAQMVKNTKHRVIYCSDNKEARNIIGKFQNAVSYGFSAGADLRLTKWKDTTDGLICCLESNGKPRGQIRLPVAGRHNALNAAAACAVGLELGIPFADIARTLAEFQPVERRFEKVVETIDLTIISDYAHHPTEIAALLDGIRALKINRWLAVFQPHRYSRTKALGKLFPPAFRGIDELVLCPVYEASETKITGGTSWDLYEQFRKYDEIRTFCSSSLRQAWDYLKARATPGDGILIIGAGDVAKIAEWAGKELLDGKAATINAQRSTFNIELKSRRSKLDVECWMFNVSKFLGSRLKSSSIRFNEPLAKKTTLRVGGSADIYIEAGSLADLVLIVRWAAKNSGPLRIIGAGSNLLVSDLGVRGIVVRLKGTEWQNIRRKSNNEVVAGAGVSLPELTRWTAQHGLAGTEFLAGIPGTVGGAARMNAGAGGREFSDIVRWLRVMEQNGTVKILRPAQLDFSYRHCAGLKNRIILETALTLGSENPDVIRKQMSQIRERRNWMRGMRSAGSIFKNPGKDSAGRLIENLGLKGRRIGGAKISEQHANIIITGKGANASDVLALAGITRYLVKMKYGVDLETEVEYLE